MIKAECLFDKKHLNAVYKEFFRNKLLSFFLPLLLLIPISCYLLSKYIPYVKAYNEYKELLGKRYETVPGYITEKLVVYTSIIVFNVTISAIALFIAFRLVSQMQKSLENFTPEYTHSFVFDENGITVTVVKEGCFCELFTEYAQVVGVVENGDFFFISFENRSPSAVSRQDLTEGLPGELRMLLQEKLGEKFRIKSGGGE